MASHCLPAWLHAWPGHVPGPWARLMDRSTGSAHGLMGLAHEPVPMGSAHDLVLRMTWPGRQNLNWVQEVPKTLFPSSKHFFFFRGRWQVNCFRAYFPYCGARTYGCASCPCEVVDGKDVPKQHGVLTW